MSEIKIRPATPQDRSRAVYVEGLSTPGLHYLDKVYDAWLRDKDTPLLVAEIEGEIAGVGKFSVLPDGSAWLETLRVLPSKQNLGIGKAFYKKFLQIAKEKEISQVRMYTGTTSYASKGLAELNGFKLAGTFRGSYLLLPKSVDDTYGTGFKPVTELEHGLSLVSPLEKEWDGFAIMNRTFFRISDHLIKDWIMRGLLYHHADSGTVIALGARFIPEQALHIAFFDGDTEIALNFAIWKALSIGNHRLQCMFPEASESIRIKLRGKNFAFEDSCCIVMEHLD